METDDHILVYEGAACGLLERKTRNDKNSARDGILGFAIYKEFTMALEPMIEETRKGVMLKAE